MSKDDRTTTADRVRAARVAGLPLEQARICVTGYDHNRPDPFPGLGDFIGWLGGVNRLANGELLFVHSTDTARSRCSRMSRSCFRTFNGTPHPSDA